MMADRTSSMSLIEPIVHISKNLAAHQRYLMQLYTSLGYSQPTLLVGRKFSELYQDILMTIKDQANRMEEEVEALTREIGDLIDDIQYLRVYLEDHRLERWDLQALSEREVTIPRLKKLQKIKQELIDLKYERESQDLRFHNSGPEISPEYLQKSNKHGIEWDPEASEPSLSSTLTKDYDQARFDSKLLAHLRSNRISETGDDRFSHHRTIPMPVTHENLARTQKRISELRKESLSCSKKTLNYCSRDVGCWDPSLLNDGKRDERVASNSRAIIEHERSFQLKLTYKLANQEKVEVIQREWVQRSQESMRPYS
ncbi:hypothetical protein DFH28DRAFT_955727 [Melampsora americana]|nr:hypothetical protein DFH28DRAFT_955727 [Melampsora americana]